MKSSAGVIPKCRDANISLSQLFVFTQPRPDRQVKDSPRSRYTQPL